MAPNYIRACVTLVVSLFADGSTAAVLGGVRSDFNIWQTGVDGVVTGPSLGADLSYGRGAWYGGAGFVQSVLGNNAANVKVSRGDADFAVGRMIDENWSAFAGLKLISLRYQNDSVGQAYTESIKAFGVGANGLVPVFPRSYLYGTFSLSYLSSNYEGVTQDVASGYHVGEEAGLLYNVNGSVSIRGGVKHQWFSLKYSSVANSWASDLYRFGAQISYRF